MQLKRIVTGLQMITIMLLRRRIIWIALLVIPLVFLSIVELTAPTFKAPFRLASIDHKKMIWEPMKHIALVFFSLTSSGFLVSLLALNLVQIEIEVNRRLVLCGYHPFELLISNLLSLLILVVLIALYIGILVHFFLPIDHFLPYLLGLMLIGFVYGCYGLAVGSLIKGKLEGVFFIVLMANIDAGWLQNPMYYAEAHNNVVIRYLPAYFPSQSAIIAAFTDFSGLEAILNSVLYASAFLLVALVIFYLKMRIRNERP